MGKIEKQQQQQKSLTKMFVAVNQQEAQCKHKHTSLMRGKIDVSSLAR